MEIEIQGSRHETAAAAAARAAEVLRTVIAEKGRVHVIAATGASQIEFLEALVKIPGIEWSRATFFHLDEYVGLPERHPASFRRYLKERILGQVTPAAF